MKGYGELTRAMARSSLREPVGFFFILVFAPMLLILLGVFFGNDPKPEFGGLGFVDKTLPAFAALVLAIIGVMRCCHSPNCCCEKPARSRDSG